MPPGQATAEESAVSAQRLIIVPVLLLMGARMLASCGQDPPRQRVYLADYDFSASWHSAAYDTVFGNTCNLHAFSSGWSKDTGAGIWTVGDSSRFHLFALGRSCTLTVSGSTSPELAVAGQRCDVFVNGHEVGGLAFERGWQTAACTLAVADEILVQGLNEVLFRPAHHLRDGGFDLQSEKRSLAIFVQTLTATAELDAGQQEHLQRQISPARTVPGWNLVPVDPEAGLTSLGTATTRPDILLIMPDAARADHFSCYGYRRETTPSMDRLAAEGRRFTQVHSVSSYTRSAVPSLLTGLSWRDHKVVRGIWDDAGDALADTFLTMAEILRVHGYATYGLSQNPNFSRGTNMDQGFDEFDQVWRGSGLEQGYAEQPERVFTERIARGFGSRPVFCMLHLLPPHLPYAPGPEHDLWRAPDYQGPVPDEVILRPEKEFERLGQDPAPADAERYRSLYDGNLHRIDASVGRIVARWQALGRKRPMLVIIVSDHGEAFGEHGRFTHGDDIHNEMTWIPLIFWPANLTEPLAGAVERELSITDVLPMLMHLLDLPVPDDRAWPERFLAVRASPAAPRDGHLLRAVHPSHIVGWRSAGFLLVYNGLGRQEMYDLRSDPAARCNLRLERPEAYAEMLRRMRAVLSQGVASVASGLAELDDTDRRNLRALGY